MIAAGQPAAGSFTAGAAVAAVGIAFAGVAAVTSSADLEYPRRQWPGRRRPRRGVPDQRDRQHGRARRPERPAGGERLAGLAVADRLGPADAAVRRRQLVAAGPGGRTVRSSVPVAAAAAGRTPRLRARHAAAAHAATRRPAARCAARSGWRGGCSAARCSAGRSACSASGLVMGGLVGQVRDSTGTARDWYTQMGGSDADPRCLPHLDHADGGHGGGDLRRPGAAAHARRGGRRAAGAGPRDRGQPVPVGGRSRRHRGARRDRDAAAVRHRHGAGSGWCARRPGRAGAACCSAQAWSSCRRSS